MKTNTFLASLIITQELHFVEKSAVQAVRFFSGGIYETARNIIP